MITESKMDAIVLHGVGTMKNEKLPVPDLRPGTARIKIGYCGVCGSDIPRSFVKGTYSFPTVCGHEFAGTVEAIADGQSKFRPGDRVVVFPLIWKDEHPACEEGQYAQSDGYDYLGSRSDGGFADYVVAPLRNLIRIPDGVSLEEAAMTEPAAVALHAARRGRIGIGDTVSIFGLGPIGLMLAQWARSMGAAQVLLFDLQEGKLELARKLGFSQVYNSRTVDSTEVIETTTGGRGVHVAFEAAGVAPTMLAALRATRRAGRTVLLGNPSGEVTLPAVLISQVMRREIEIVGTWNSGYSVHGDDDDWRTTLQAMDSGSLDLKVLVTHRVPLSRGIQALEMMRDQSEFYAKVLLHPES